MSSWLGSIAAAAAVLITGWVAGSALLHPLTPRRRVGAAGEVGLATAVGLGMVSLAGLALSLAGLLRPAAVIPLLLAVHGAAWRRWAAVGRAVTSGRVARVVREEPAGVAVGLLAVAAVTVLALYPPLASDATVYHLPYAESLLTGNPPGLLPEARFPIFPQAMESLYALAMVLGGELAAQLVHSATGWLAAAVLLGWGVHRGSPAAGRLAAALWLGSAHLVWLAGQAYVDVGLSLFVCAGWLAWEVWDRTAVRGWLLAAGAAFGAAAASKYLGLFFVAWFALRTAVRAGGSRRRRALVAAAFVVVALAVLGPWYARVAWHTGSPLFPFYPAIFGASEWTPAAPGADQAAAAPAGWTVAARGLATLLRVPWDAVFQRDRYSLQPPWNPLWIVLLPLLAVVAIRGPPVGWLGRLAAVLAYSLLWLSLEPRDLRFLLPVLPALGISVGEALDDLSGAGGWRSARWLALPSVRRSLVLLALCPGLLFAGFEVAERGLPPATAAERQAFLESRVPGYGAVAWLAAHGAGEEGVYALYGARLRYYAGGRWLGDWAGPDRYPVVQREVWQPGELAARLRRSEARWFLVFRGDGAPNVRLPANRDFLGRFEPAAVAEDYLLYRLLDEPAPAQ